MELPFLFALAWLWPIGLPPFGIPGIALWFVLGIAFAAAAWRLASAGRMRTVAPLGVLVLYLLAPRAYYEVRMTIGQYYAQKEAWLAAQCGEITGAAVAKVDKPAPVEGFIVAVNYDGLINDRFQRVAAEELRGGSGHVDTGRYQHHPVLGAIPGESFAQRAHTLLAQKGFSFVEFEMTPSASGKGYDNAGNLNTEGWSGKRYRRFYLAPGDHRHCTSPAGDYASPSGGTALGGFYENLAKRPGADASKHCIAFEVVDKPLGKYRLTAAERTEWLWWRAKLRGVSVPAVTVVRADYIGVESEGAEIYRYFGFNYPDERTSNYRCNSVRTASSIAGTVLVPDTSRAYYRAQSWYAGSAVQRHYEPDKVAAMTPPAAAAGTACPLRPRAEKGALVVDQLEDFTSRSQTMTESSFSGTQPASFFSLGRNVTIARLAWSGGKVERDDFRIQIFKDANGLPGAVVKEFDIGARSRLTGTYGGSARIYEATPQNLNLAAGDYWLSVTTTSFFWAMEPQGERPHCGSGGAKRHGGGSWQEGGNVHVPFVSYGSQPLSGSTAPVVKPLINHRTARGYSIRIEAR